MLDDLCLSLEMRHGKKAAHKLTDYCDEILEESEGELASMIVSWDPTRSLEAFQTEVCEKQTQMCKKAKKGKGGKRGRRHGGGKQAGRFATPKGEL